MNVDSKMYVPERKIDVVIGKERPHPGYLAFSLDDSLVFSTEGLESYSFSKWNPLIFDAMTVAAAIEFGDRVVKRPSHGWRRNLSLHVPVHDPDHWRRADLSAALHDAIGFLTGDEWKISFKQRTEEALSPRQAHLDFSFKASTVLAYSDGLDSRAVAGIVESKIGQGLIRVRVGSDLPKSQRKNQPFASVPYKICLPCKDKETSARNRGFKFSMIGAIAAYLCGAEEVTISESGQGAIGPALISVGHAYPDFRNHPLFIKRMELFVSALFGRQIKFVFPRLWHTKGETLKEYVTVTGNNDWQQTKSCWKNNQWSSVSGQFRQCGICAACMLRRLSIHGAGLEDEAERYICENLTAPDLPTAVVPDFKGLSRAYEQYAIAGVLHLDHLADMSSQMAANIVQRHARLLAPALGLTTDEASDKLAALLERHALEWKHFVNSLGENSFVKKWVRTRI